MEKLKIEGFKCFKDILIPINELTVLVGSNGFGKRFLRHNQIFEQFFVLINIKEVF